MNRNILLLFLLSMVSLTLSAQHTVQGKVLDKNNEGAIEMAAVRLLNPADSTLVQGVLTDDKGDFTLPRVKDGKYLIEVRFLGYEPGFTAFTMSGRGLILKNIYMMEKAKELAEVEVKGNAAQMVVKNDTIEYNVAAFKTAENAVVEDLLKKLPGVVVDADGNITANGEKITKIRVDGKKFFDGDIQMTTKNMPVDIVDKVQVVDQKSEMSQLTGFEDDNTERIINLTIKKNRKQGIFGNASGGIGADLNKDIRYDSNAFLNIMDGESQTALVSGLNNTNTQRSGRGRGGMPGAGGGGRGGITETQNIGINNNTEINKNLKIGGDGSYNHSNNISETESERESWLKGSTFTNKNNSHSTTENHEGNLRLELEWNIDTLTTLIAQ
ncbi:MAG: carboxypeptidase-like regulatory domain-containing protein, partial [Bacteroidota bacterium]|nr:carboxypeptidase-like regulatory domain-containing protein [Bacteroidota bacterium]